MAESRVGIRFEGKDAASTTINKIDKGIQDLGHSGTRVFDDLTTRTLNWAKGIGSVSAALMIIKKVADLSEIGNRALGVEKAFKNMTDRIGLSGEKIVSDLKKASRGAIAEMEIITSATRANLLGIPLDKLSGLMDIATASAKATGSSVAQMFDDIVVGVGRASPMILDNLGIVVREGEANNVYAKALGKTSEQLTAAEKKQALLNAVLLAGEEIIKKVGVTAGGTGAAQLAVYTQQIGENIGKFILPGYRGINTILGGILGYVDEWVEKTANITVQVRDLAEEYRKLGVYIEEKFLKVAIESGAQAQAQGRGALISISKYYMELQAKITPLMLNLKTMGAGSSAFKNVLEVIVASSTTADEINERATAALSYMEKMAATGKVALTAMEEKGLTSTDTYKELKRQVEALTGEIKDLVQKTIDYADAMAKVAKAADFWKWIKQTGSAELQLIKLVAEREEIEANIAKLQENAGTLQGEREQIRLKFLNQQLKKLQDVNEQIKYIDLTGKMTEIKLKVTTVEKVETTAQAVPSTPPLYTNTKGYYDDMLKALRKEVVLKVLEVIGGMSGMEGFAGEKNTYWTRMTDEIDSVIYKIKDFGDKVYENTIVPLKELGPKIVEAVSDPAELARNAVGFLYEKLKNGASLVWDALKDTAQVVGEALKKTAQAVGDTLLQVAQWFYNLVLSSETLSTYLENLATTLKTVVADLGTAVVNVISPIVNLVVATVSVVSTVLATTLEVIETALTDNLPIIKTVFAIIVQIVEVLTSLLTPVLSVVSYILTALSPILSVISTILLSLSSIITPLLPVIMVIATIVSTVLAPILTAISPLLTTIATILTALDPIFAIFAVALDAVSRPLEFLGDIVSYVAKWISYMGAAVSDFIYNITHWGSTQNTAGAIPEFSSTAFTRPLIDWEALKAQISTSTYDVDTLDEIIAKIEAALGTVTLPSTTTATSTSGTSTSTGSTTTVTRVPDIYNYNYFNGVFIGAGSRAEIGQYIVECIQEYVGIGGQVTFVEG